jgi:Holliday junction resolvasome RuvABC DNA-binding subunit
MDKVTLDFENNMIEWDSDTQKGTEHCPDLHERKAAILAAMGYEQYDLTDVVNTVNAFANGEMTIDELEEQLKKQRDEE